MKKLWLVAAALAIHPATAAAADSEGIQEAPKEKKICRTEKATGSRTRVNRICMTQAEWDRLAQKTDKTLGDLTRQQGTAQGQPTNPMAGGSGPF